MVYVYNKLFKKLELIEVPCRKCLGCAMMRSMEWSFRMMMELQYTEGVFLTLTYDDMFLPVCDDGSMTLVKKHIVDFMKRFRFKVSGRGVSDIKYYLCGEYGDTGRPHYHIALFGKPWEFYKPVKLSPGKFSSDLILNVWQFGFNEIGVLNQERIRYVTKYMDKHVSEKYRSVVYLDRQVPFCRMSKGIGLKWIIDNKNVFTDLDSSSLRTVDGNLASFSQYYLRKVRQELSETEQVALADKIKIKQEQTAQSLAIRYGVTSPSGVKELRKQIERDREAAKRGKRTL